MERTTITSGKTTVRFYPTQIVNQGPNSTIVNAINEETYEPAVVKVSALFSADGIPVNQSDKRRASSPEQFINEIRTLKQLNGIQHVPELYASERRITPDGSFQFYIGQSRIPGKSVEQWRKEDAIAWEPSRIRLLLLSVAKALSAVHERGIVHADLKRSSIMLSEYEEYGIVDWGNARALNTPAIDNNGHIIATAEFASPEQGRAEPLNEQSDIYSLGVIAFTLLYGLSVSHRFSITNGELIERSSKEILQRVGKNTPLPYDRIPTPENNVEKHLQEVLTRMTQPSLNDRFRTCYDVINEIKGLYHGQS